RSSQARFAPPPGWYEHPDTCAVTSVFLTEEFDQIPFLQCDTNKNVGRRDEGEEQMACSHHWRGPEGDDEAEIDRVPHKLVEHRRFETRLYPCFPGKVHNDLLQPEQFEMVDQERAQQHDKPAEE